MKKGFEPFRHTADIGLKVRGRTLKEFFENAARGLFSILTDRKTINPKNAVIKKIKVKGKDSESLLVNWLNELIYEAFKDKAVFYRFKADMRQNGALKADITGSKLREKDKFLREIKAATYHNLAVKKLKTGYYAEIILDV